MVTQEFSLVGPMTVTENVVLAAVGCGPVDAGRTGPGSLAATAARLGVDVDPTPLVDAPVGRRAATGGDRQGAVPRLPRADPRRTDGRAHARRTSTPLFGTVHRLHRRRAWASLFISHKLHEVVEIADRVTVLRRGRMVADRAGGRARPRRHRRLMMGAAADAARAARPTARPRRPPADADRGRGGRRRRTAPARDRGAPGPRPRGGEGGRASTTCRSDRAPPARSSGSPASAATARPSWSRCSAAQRPPDGGHASHVDGVDVTTLDVVGRLRAGLGRLTEDRRGSVVPSLTRRAEPRAGGPRPLPPPTGSPPAPSASTPGR